MASTGDSHLADSIVVGDLAGARIIPSAAFLAGIRERAKSAAYQGDALEHQGTQVIELGPAYALVTGSWRLTLTQDSRVTHLDLISDFLVERTEVGLKCLTYTARQDILAASKVVADG
ncbi:hypothetical protein PJL15_00854 [Paenarthrobacter nitroguajacolicus]|nr:hypothetical protein [Paenarthrobacter nitroguajacolicus]